jgi:hypothetical protein
MSTYHDEGIAPALGMTTMVLGSIALLLAFLPVLGLPISACGLLCGVLGLATTLRRGGEAARRSVGGTALCCLALAANFALAYAPAGYLTGWDVPRSWQVVPDRPYVPPPEQK